MARSARRRRFLVSVGEANFVVRLVPYYNYHTRKSMMTIRAASVDRSCRYTHITEKGEKESYRDWRARCRREMTDIILAAAVLNQ